MAPVRQPSFAGGELGEEFWGRVDLARYAAGARRVRDFVVTKTGALQNRGGFRYLGTLVNASLGCRLLPFAISDADGYVLEFTHQFLRIWHNGALVKAYGYTLETETPYTGAELRGLRYVQSGDVLTLTHPAHPPHELRRVAEDNWTLTEIGFAVRAPYFPSYPPALLAPLQETDTPDNPARAWAYAVTTVGKDADGTAWESAPHTVTQVATPVGQTDFTFTGGPPALCVSTGHPVTVTWKQFGLVQSPGFTVLSWRVYRGRGTVLGLIGETSDTEFRDVGNEPDYAQPPPQGRHPFEVRAYDTATASNEGAVLRTEYPATVAYHSDRLWLGATVQRPTTLWGSAVGDYHNYDNHYSTLAGESVELTLAARHREEVRWLASREDLLIGTSENVWALSAADGGHVLGNETPYARVESTAGCAAVDYVGVESSVVFARSKGGGLYAVVPKKERRGWDTTDLGLWAPHMVQGVAELAYTDEGSVLWVLRSDGTLASLTYSPAQELSAWALHATQGSIATICAVPENGRDALYACVKRNPLEGTQPVAQYSLERLEAHSDDAVRGIYLDASLTFDSAGASLSGLTHLRGLNVVVLADGAPYGPLTVPQNGVLPLPVESAGHVVVGLPYTPSLETLGLGSAQQEVGTRKKSVASVAFEAVASAGGVWVGETLEDTSAFSEWETREAQAFYQAGPPRTGLVELRTLSTWNTHGRAALQLRLPLPLTVTGVVREVVLGG